MTDVHDAAAVSDNVIELMSADRELSEAEQRRLKKLSQHGIAGLRRAIRDKVRTTYATSSVEDFATCTQEHMTTADILMLRDADRYHCPRCGNLLKDRERRPAVEDWRESERERLRGLWLDMEEAADDKAYGEALVRFREALGLP